MTSTRAAAAYDAVWVYARALAGMIQDRQALARREVMPYGALARRLGLCAIIIVAAYLAEKLAIVVWGVIEKPSSWKSQSHIYCVQ